MRSPADNSGVEHIKLLELEAKSRQLAGLSNMIRGFETTSSQFYKLYTQDHQQYFNMIRIKIIKEYLS